MSVIHLQTEIAAPPERVFDLARSIDLHMQSAGKSAERAVAGRTSGLIELGETVTWEARHFGIWQRLTVKITRMERPHLFEDVLVSGAFASMRHLHTFRENSGGTLMEDEFEFAAPLGMLGTLAEKLFLTNYMRSFLVERNRVLKEAAESMS